MARLCEQLALCESDHLLEIGTGWGAMAEYAARHYGCRVTTTTLSQEQYIWATERIARAGLQDRVEVLLCDYRDLTGQYDKLVSIEMIEAVGQRYLPTFFRTCQARLRPGGRMAIQAITIQDQRYRDYSKSVDFIQRYIFPGGFLPSITAMNELMTRHTDLWCAISSTWGRTTPARWPTGGSALSTPGRRLKSSALMNGSAACGCTTLATAKPGLTPAPSAWCS
jgi:cyclopropane-fatty-acyl-phospholipid synthase